MKVNYKTLQWGKAIAYIGGGGCAVIFALGGPRWVAIGMAVSAIAKLIDLLWPQPTQTLTPTAVAKDNKGEVTGSIVTTTTTEPIVAPQKGTT